MIRLSIRRPITVAMVYLAAALLGVAAWRNVPLELLPDTQLPQLHVSASWRGASPEAMEAFVTSPIEGAVQQVRGISKVTSVSEEQFGMGTARLTLAFVRGTDMDFARLELAERLSALERELPPGLVGPRVEQYVPEEFQRQRQPFLKYTVSGPYTLEALRAHVDRIIAPELLQVAGVADVDVQGGRDRVIEIELDDAKIGALGLDPETVRRRILELEYVQNAGVVDAGGTLRTVAIRQEAASPEDVRQLALLADRGRLVRVSDVATVHHTYEEPHSHYRIDGQPAVSFEMRRRAGTNAVAVADRVKERLASLDGTHPSGTRLILDQDESRAIRTQLTDLRSRALISAAVIFAVLLLFLRSLRSAAIVFATIAFSALITLNLIYFGGYTLNVLTLMGLAMGFGLIVDNAIVVLENIYRRRRLGESAGLAAERGTREVVLAVLAATLTTVVVFIPFMYLQGELRVYYLPLAIAVGFSLLASLFVSFSFIPALAGWLLRDTPDVRMPSIRDGSGHAGVAAGTAAPAQAPVYARVYAGLLAATLRFPWVTIAIALIALGGSYWLFNEHVVRGTLWRSWWAEQSYIDILIRLPRGSELERTDELARFFEERLAVIPEVERFVTNAQPQYASIRVTFPDSLQSTTIPPAIKEQLVAYSLEFGGAEVRVIGYGPSFYGGGSSPPNYSIKVLGYNYETVREIAEELGRRLQRFSRIRDVDTNASGRWYQHDRATELVLRVDRSRLAVHQLTVRDLVQQVGAAVQGQTRNDPLRVGGEEVRLAVKREGHRQLDVRGLEDLLLPVYAGSAVRLGDVAAVEEREVLGRIVREDQQYQRTVAYEFRGPAKLGDRVHEVVMAATRLPDGYALVGKEDWSWGLEEEEQIYGVLVVSLLLIFMVTAALFESVRQPVCVLLTVPMALIGVFLIFFYTGASFTREAYIGVIMMGGIVVNNAILLVDRVNQLRREGQLALHEAIVSGSLQRVRPILMTSVSTVLGLLPLVLFSTDPDANIWNALGYALIGGLSSSTILVLTVTPALYLLLERGDRRRPVGEAA